VYWICSTRIEYSSGLLSTRHTFQFSVRPNRAHFIEHKPDRKIWGRIRIQPRIIIRNEITWFNIRQLEITEKYLCDPTSQVLSYLKMLWIGKIIYRQGNTNEHKGLKEGVSEWVASHGRADLMFTWLQRTIFFPFLFNLNSQLL
jgi:hypothetical protein